jgi:putative RecB family exonuclease
MSSPYADKLAGVAWWEPDGLHLAPKANSRLVRNYLSPSSASSYRSCPARFAVEKLLPRPEDPFGAAELGSAGHAVLEELMGLEPSLRTPVRAGEIITGHLPAAAERHSAVVEVFARLHKLGARAHTPETARRIAGQVETRYIDTSDLVGRVGQVFASLDGKPLKRAIVSQAAAGLPGANELTLPGPDDMGRWSEAVSQKIAGLWQIEDPTKADVWHRELRAKVTVDGVPIYGIIDRVDRGNSSIPIVVDYKTGKPGRGDKHGDQLRGYCIAVADKTGIMPYRALAYYTAHGVSQEIDVGRKAVNKTIATFVQVWADMQASQAAATWPAKASPLCGWCPLALVCPAAQAAGKAVPRSDIAFVGPELGIGEPSTGSLVARQEPGAEAPVGVGAHVGAPDRSIEAGHEDKPMEASTMSTTDIKFGPDTKSWDQVSGEGLLNPNSYSAQALFGFVELSVEALEGVGQKLGAAQVDALAQTFARLVADTQLALGARASLQDGLNSRLRGALHTALDRFPVPFGKGAEEWGTWYQAVLRRMVSIARAALRLWSASEDLPEKPWAIFVAETATASSENAA